MTVYGAFTAGASFVLTQAVLDGRGQGVSIGHPGALRVVVASALLAPVCALAGLGLGALIRHSATTTVFNVFVLLFLPTFVTDRYHWTACVRNALPFNAWYRLVDVEYGHQPFTLTPRYQTTVTGGWIVFGAGRSRRPSSRWSPLTAATCDAAHGVGPASARTASRRPGSGVRGPGASFRAAAGSDAPR